MQIDAEVGEQRVGAGVPVSGLRAGGYNELIVNDSGLGRYFEAARVGRVFFASAAGVTVGTAGAVTNPVLSLLMPQSGKMAAVILEALWVPKAVGTFAAYTVAFYGASGLNGTATTNVTPFNGQIGAAGSTAKCYAAVASTFTAAPTLVRPMAQGYQVTYAGTSAGLKEELAGAIIVPPGTGVALNASASQTAGTADVSLVYAEIDWPLG